MEDQLDKSKEYNESRQLINDIIVELFNNILMIEERSLIKKGISLSMTEVHTIEAIGIGNKKTMSDIADNLEITMGTLTTMITKLERKGYVQRERASNDKRVVLASLTEKGKAIEQTHRNFHDEMIDHLMADLKLDEDKALILALKNINDFFIREYGGTNGH